MEIVKITDGDYLRFEELLLQRDSLMKQAEQYRLEYILEFGQLVTDSFSLKVDCIKLKKEITLYQAAKNRGEHITEEEVRQYLDVHMAAYYVQLKELTDRNDEAKSAKPVTPYEASEIKKVYRRIAKQLHPDLSTLTEDYPELAEYFQDAMAAYNANNLRALQNVEVLINRFLDEKGLEHVDVVITDVEARCTELEEDINGITSTEPYTYKAFLADAVRVSARKKELEDEIEEFTKYREELTEYLTALKNGG